MSSYYPSMVNVQSIAGTASNVSHNDNPPFTLGDFLNLHPQFTNEVVPTSILQQFINIANQTVFNDLWGELWTTAMGWFIAHFCVIYIQGKVNAGSSEASILQAATTKGLVSSKSVDSVSISYDYSALQSLQAWAGFTLTSYGAQYVTFAKMLGKGGMYIW